MFEFTSVSYKQVKKRLDAKSQLHVPMIITAIVGSKQIFVEFFESCLL